jgi:MtN3 and saliva related transmembrane protein
MPMAHGVFHWLAGIGGIVNALLFVPQIVKLLRCRSAEGVSTAMYAGFLVLQLVTGVDLVFHRIWPLATGMAASAIATFTILVLAVHYQHRAADSTARSA